MQRVPQAAAQFAERSGIGRPGRVPNTRELAVLNTRFIVPYRMRAGLVEVLLVFRTSRQQANSHRLNFASGLRQADYRDQHRNTEIDQHYRPIEGRMRLWFHRVRMQIGYTPAASDSLCNAPLASSAD